MRANYGEPDLQSRMYKRSLGIDYFDAWVVYRVNGKSVVVVTAGDAKSYMELLIYDTILPRYKEKYGKDLSIDVLLIASHDFHKINDYLKEISNGDVEVFTKDRLDVLSKGITFEANGQYLYDYVIELTK